MSNIPPELQAEAERMLRAAGARPDEPDGPRELTAPAHFLGAVIQVQCGSCAAVGRETPLQIQVSNSDIELLADLVIVCPVCSQESLAQAGVRTVIPIGIYVGEEAEIVDEALERLAGGTDGSHPFAGIEAVDGPVPVPGGTPSPEGDNSP